MADDSSEIVKEAAESVSFENVKTGGGQNALHTSMMNANEVAHQQAMYLKIQQQADIGQAIAGKVAELIMATSPSEAGGDVAALGQLLKALQMTPPPTNLPTQGQ